VTKDTRKARFMLHVRQAGVTDARVMRAVETVPREMFVIDTFTDYAYDDTALPIQCGQTISQPSLVAMMTAALDVGERMKVLEIGTGSGYQAAILSKLCRRVYTIDRHRELVVEAEARFQALDRHNITTRVGDGALGWPEQAPFERIMVTAAAERPPETLIGQLAIDGRMIVPIGPPGGPQMLCRIRRDADGVHREDLLEVRFVPLIEGNAEASPS